MLSNIPFIGIMIVTILVQLLMVEFGGRMVKCWPMNQMQNIICIVIGAGELIWGFLVKVVPTKFFMNLSLEDKDKEDGSKKVYLSQAIRPSKANVTTKK
jgi:Ca2+ transporting ATPase